jgi:hypothetical protein
MTAPSMETPMSFTVNPTEEQGCDPLLAWAFGPWPDYNEEAMMTGLNSAFRYGNNQQFCDGFVRPA